MKRLSCSNLAWHPCDDDAVAALLRAHQIEFVDLCPTKYFPDILKTTRPDVVNVANKWEQRGMRVWALQSLLYGTMGLNIFGSRKVQQKMLNYLAKVFQIGRWLGARVFVFGSPRNRNPGQLDTERAWEMARVFFANLAQRASDQGVVFTIEANSVDTGCSFLTQHGQAATMVREINSPACKLQFDSATLMTENLQADKILHPNAELIGHVHASEPGFGALRGRDEIHRSIANLLGQILPDVVVCLEMMVPSAQAGNLSWFESSLTNFVKQYGSVEKRFST